LARIQHFLDQLMIAFCNWGLKIGFVNHDNICFLSSFLVVKVFQCLFLLCPVPLSIYICKCNKQTKA